VAQMVPALQGAELNMAVPVAAVGLAAAAHRAPTGWMAGSAQIGRSRAFAIRSMSTTACRCAAIGADNLAAHVEALLRVAALAALLTLAALEARQALNLGQGLVVSRHAGTGWTADSAQIGLGRAIATHSMLTTASQWAAIGAQLRAASARAAAATGLMAVTVALAAAMVAAVAAAVLAADPEVLLTVLAIMLAAGRVPTGWTAGNVQIGREEAIASRSMPTMARRSAAIGASSLAACAAEVSVARQEAVPAEAGMEVQPVVGMVAAAAREVALRLDQAQQAVGLVEVQFAQTRWTAHSVMIGCGRAIANSSMFMTASQWAAIGAAGPAVLAAASTRLCEAYQTPCARLQRSATCQPSRAQAQVSLADAPPGA